MATWYYMECDNADRWSKFSDTDTEPTEEELVCPPAGHPAIILARFPMDRLVKLTIAAISDPPTSQSDKFTKFFLEMSTWDGQNFLRSAKTFTWEEAVKRAEWFHNLSWEDAERRWARLKM